MSKVARQRDAANKDAELAQFSEACNEAPNAYMSLDWMPEGIEKRFIKGCAEEGTTTMGFVWEAIYVMITDSLTQSFLLLPDGSEERLGGHWHCHGDPNTGKTYLLKFIKGCFTSRLHKM